MVPMSSMRYSTTTGSSFDKQMVTVRDRAVAFVKETKYRSAKVSMTGSLSSMITLSSFLSAVLFCLHQTGRWSQNRKAVVTIRAELP